MRPAWPGVAACAIYGVHAGYHVWRGTPEEALWGCTMATLAVGVGWLAGSPTLHAVGVLWLTLGLPFWLLDLVMGGEFIPTSVLTHLGGLAIGLAGLARLGMPRHAWWRAVAAFAVLQAICRWTTPPSTNVNVAHSIWKGWEGVFPSYPVYWAVMLAVYGVVFFAAETAYRCAMTRVTSLAAGRLQE